MPKRIVHLDQYFTSAELVQECIRELEKVVDVAQFDQILEPAAGCGRFMDVLPVDQTIGIDIDPRDSRVLEQDFFQWSSPKTCRLLVIGNPPFGQRGALAVKFMNHAMNFADTVAFLLPRSFNKFTFQNRVDRYFELIHASNHDGLFEYYGDEVSVSVVFQIWQRSLKKRDLLVPPKTHPHFSMRHAHLSRIDEVQRKELIDFAHIALPQVGAKFQPVDPTMVVKGSYWFIKLNENALLEAFSQLDFSFLDGTNTAHTSLSKADIVRAYTEAAEIMQSSQESSNQGGAQQPLF